MPSIDYPQIWTVPLSRLYALAWAGIFFICINLAVWVLYHEQPPFERLPYNSSYEDIRQAVETIRSDNQRTIVFLGGSVMWGANSPTPEETIPGYFSQLVPDDVAVYNLGLIAARPLDEYVLAWLLKDDADLIIADYNYEFGFPVSQERLIREPATYLRHRQLFDTYADPLTADIPAIRACFEQWSLPIGQSETVAEAELRSFWQWSLPVLYYKQHVNNALFGQHPLLLFERLVEGAADLVRGTQTLADLFTQPEFNIHTDAWQPQNTPEEIVYVETFTAHKYDADTFIHCLDRAFIDSARSQSLPLALYLTPTNPGLFPLLHTSDIFRQNVALLEEQFGADYFYNLDDGQLPASLFADSTHVLPAGAKIIAQRLYDTLKDDPRFTSLLTE